MQEFTSPGRPVQTSSLSERASQAPNISGGVPGEGKVINPQGEGRDGGALKEHHNPGSAIPSWNAEGHGGGEAGGAGLAREGLNGVGREFGTTSESLQCQGGDRRAGTDKRTRWEVTATGSCRPSPLLPWRGSKADPEAPGAPLGSSGRMFPPAGCRRGQPREPGPWWDEPRPCPPPGPEDTWGEPPRELQRRRRCHRRRQPSPRDPRPFHGPGDVPWKEEERWAPHDCPPQPPWNDREEFQGPENGFGDGWHLPSPRAPRPFRGPGDVPWKEEEEDGRWAPHDYPPPPPWHDREFQGREDGFGDVWHPELLPDPWSEFPKEERPPPWPPCGPPRTPGAFRGHWPPWSHRPAGKHSPRRSHLRQLTPVPVAWCPRPPPAHKPHSKPSPVPSKRSQPLAGKKLEPPQPPTPLQGAAERPKQEQDVPVTSGNVLEPPSPAGSPLESPAPHPGAVEPLVELEAGQTPVGSQEQDPCVLGTDPAPLEETSRYPEIQEHLEVETCSPGVPKAGTCHRSRPQSPAAPPDPAKRELLDSSSSGEAGAELSPHSWEQALRGAGEVQAEAVQDGPLQSLQPPENPQVPPGCAVEPKAWLSQAPPGACTTPETSLGSQRPPGSCETNLAVSLQHQLSCMLPAPFPAGIDFRSAAVLAKKAEIELSYQQFSLTIAVVATMLLQKEPSMEAALGLALRANLRQCRSHHLQQLEDFIDTIDSATSSL